jgi:hypothetical protein
MSGSERLQDAEIAVHQGAIAIIFRRGAGERLTSSEPLAEVQRALLVVLVLHTPHPEAGGLLGLRKLREHYMSSWDNPDGSLGAPSSLTLESPTRPLATPPPRAPRPPPPPCCAVMCVVELAKGHTGAKGQTAACDDDGLWLVYRRVGGDVGKANW